MLIITYQNKWESKSQHIFVAEKINKFIQKLILFVVACFINDLVKVKMIEWMYER